MDRRRNSRVSAKHNRSVMLKDSEESVTMLWDDDWKQDFLIQKCLIEDVFQRESVLCVLQGEVSVKFARPAPLFPYVLSGYRHPGLLPKQLVPHADVQVLADLGEYNGHLDEFEVLCLDWYNQKVTHDELIRKADRVFYQVFGINARMSVHTVLIGDGIAAAWKCMVGKHTATSATAEHKKSASVAQKRDLQMLDHQGTQTSDMETSVVDGAFHFEADRSVGPVVQQKVARTRRTTNSITKKPREQIVTPGARRTPISTATELREQAVVTTTNKIRADRSPRQGADSARTSVAQKSRRVAARTSSVVSECPDACIPEVAPMPAVVAARTSSVISLSPDACIPEVAPMPAVVAARTSSSVSECDACSSTIKEVPCSETASHHLSTKEVQRSETASHHLSTKEVPCSETASHHLSTEEVQRSETATHHLSTEEVPCSETATHHMSTKEVQRSETATHHLSKGLRELN